MVKKVTEKLATCNRIALLISDTVILNFGTDLIHHLAAQAGAYL
jgi:hypothetical protein